MSLTIASVATRESDSSSTTLVSGAFSADVGDFLLVFVAADNAGADGATSLQSSASDTAGNTYTNRVLTTYDPGLVNRGTTLGVWTAPVTTALSSGTVSVAFSPSTTVKVMRVMRARPAPGYRVSFSAVGSSTTGNISSINRALGTISSGYTVFGTAAFGDPDPYSVTFDSDTTNGTWAAGLSAQKSRQQIIVQYKTTTDTGGQDWNVIISDAVGSAVNHIVIYPDLLPSVSVAVIGNGAESVLGTPTVEVPLEVAVTGVSATAAAGYAVFPAYPEGVEAQAGLGTPTLVSGISVPATGSQVQAETGHLVTAAETIFVSGVSAAAELGSPTTRVVFLTFAQGVEATAQVSSAQAWSYVVDSQASAWTPVIN